MSIKEIQDIARQIGFAMARAGHAKRRGDKVAEAAAEAEIEALRPLIERPPTAAEIAEADAMAANIQLQGRVSVLAIQVEERSFYHPHTRRRVVRPTLRKLK
jgi:hypothetical protein